MRSAAGRIRAPCVACGKWWGQSSPWTLNSKDVRVCAWRGTGRMAQRQVWQPAAGKEGEQLFKMLTKGGHVNRPMSLKASNESRLIRKINDARRFSFWEPSSRCICFMDSGKDFHLLFWPIWGKTPFLWLRPLGPSGTGMILHEKQFRLHSDYQRKKDWKKQFLKWFLQVSSDILL